MGFFIRLLILCVISVNPAAAENILHTEYLFPKKLLVLNLKDGDNWVDLTGRGKALDLILVSKDTENAAVSAPIMAFTFVESGNEKKDFVLASIPPAFGYDSYYAISSESMNCVIADSVFLRSKEKSNSKTILIRSIKEDDVSGGKIGIDAFILQRTRKISTNSSKYNYRYSFVPVWHRSIVDSACTPSEIRALEQKLLGVEFEDDR